MSGRRLYENLRCVVGLHRLKAFRDCGDGVHIQPLDDARARPGPDDFRKCEWCGARWRGAYDGITPHWRRA